MGDYGVNTQKNFSRASSSKPDDIFTTHQNKNDNEAENTAKPPPAAQVTKTNYFYIIFLVMKV